MKRRNEFERIRGGILANDRIIHTAVASRQADYETLALIKWANGMPIVDPEREALVEDQAVQIAEREGGDVQHARAVARLLMDHSVAVQEFLVLQFESGDLPSSNLTHVSHRRAS